MRRFFGALRVRVEVVARPLPDVTQAVQGPAHGVLGDLGLGQGLQGLAEQGNRPAHVRGAEVLGREAEQGLQHVLLVFVQQAVPAPARLVQERPRVAGVRVGFDPMVDTLAANAQHPSQVGDGVTAVHLQNGQGTTEHAGIAGRGQLAPESLALPRG